MGTTAHPPNEASHEAAVAIRRFVNDEIARVATSFDGNDGSEFEFLCECGDLACQELVHMPLAAYAATPPGSVVGH
jgi:hypothetical protein